MEELEKKVLAYRALRVKINELDEERSKLGAQIVELMPKGEKQMLIAELNVRLVSRLSIRTTVEQAREYDAIKVEESVDKDKIKELVYQGLYIPNVKEFETLYISPAKEPKDEVDKQCQADA